MSFSESFPLFSINRPAYKVCWAHISSAVSSAHTSSVPFVTTSCHINLHSVPSNVLPKPLWSVFQRTGQIPRKHWHVVHHRALFARSYLIGQNIPKSQSRIAHYASCPIRCLVLNRFAPGSGPSVGSKSCFHCGAAQRARLACLLIYSWQFRRQAARRAPVIVTL